MVLVWGILAFNNGALWALRKMGHLYIKKKKNSTWKIKRLRTCLKSVF